MKNKLKKWHIALMSFMALFVAVFASLFSLRADTVDEETGEVLTDNWKFDIVFYDSSVDNGKTPLTEINWDASDGGYGEGTPRVITVQINYKNDNTVTTAPTDKSDFKTAYPKTTTFKTLTIKANTVKKICSFAFGFFCNDVVVPESVVEIEKNAFTLDSKLIVVKNSYAHKWAKKNKINFEILK